MTYYFERAEGTVAAFRRNARAAANQFESGNAGAVAIGTGIGFVATEIIRRAT